MLIFQHFIFTYEENQGFLVIIIIKIKLYVYKTYDSVLNKRVLKIVISNYQSKVFNNIET